MILHVISGGEFLLNHIKRPEDGRCYFQVTAEGQPIKIQRTIFTECFYVIAMAELARASNLSRYKVRNLSLKCFWAATDVVLNQNIGYRRIHALISRFYRALWVIQSLVHVVIFHQSQHTYCLQWTNQSWFWFSLAEKTSLFLLLRPGSNNKAQQMKN